MPDHPDLLLPAEDRPYAPMTIADLAEHYAVPTEVVTELVDRGLAMDATGGIDPFAACNHLTWYALDRVPALARRWRGYLAWFGHFVRGEDTPRRIRWRRQRRLFLPSGCRHLDWWLPRPLREPAVQMVLAETAMTAADLTVEVHPAHDVLRGAPDDRPVMATGSATLAIRPCRRLPADAAEHRRLVGVLEDLVVGFRYGYRHHQPHGLEADARAASPLGSCLDCAVLAGVRLREEGWVCRLMGGLVTHEPIVNPHFWLEVETAAGPTPVDPSLPVIAKLLGEDWRVWLEAYVGGVDARRLWLARGPSPVTDLPGGPAFSLACGEAVVTDVAGVRRNAWCCQDWVCGDCRAAFETME